MKMLQKIREFLYPVKKRIKRLFYHFKIKRVSLNHFFEVKRVKKKKKIRVAFFVIEASIWKYDLLFQLLLENPRFDPVIVICPYKQYNDEDQAYKMESCKALFARKKYPHILTISDDGNWLDVKEDVKPDIVFFTSSWPLSFPEYLIYNYLDTLTCFAGYGFHTTKLNVSNLNNPFHNLLWKRFYETESHLHMGKNFADNKAKNGVVCGYPGMDRMLKKNEKCEDLWKIKDPNIKRVIWAPHHTIPGINENLLELSTFMTYWKFMTEITEKFRKTIQFAFKPHPLLREKLKRNKIWGKEKTEKYFEFWRDQPNTFLAESDYIDLFSTSDAMIHDCGAFTAEYLYSGKPVLYLWRNDHIKEMFNEIGKKIIDVHYKASGKEDVLQFIDQQVLKGVDPLEEKRRSVFDKYIRPPKKQTASENILDHLLEEFNRYSPKN